MHGIYESKLVTDILNINANGPLPQVGMLSVLRSSLVPFLAYFGQDRDWTVLHKS